jgi:hypothetical protein
MSIGEYFPLHTAVDPIILRVQFSITISIPALCQNLAELAFGFAWHSDVGELRFSGPIRFRVAENIR